MVDLRDFEHGSDDWLFCYVVSQASVCKGAILFRLPMVFLHRYAHFFYFYLKWAMLWFLKIKQFWSNFSVTVITIMHKRRKIEDVREPCTCSPLKRSGLPGLPGRDH